MVVNSPIFIGGLRKSGTTLLRVLIAKHSNIFGGLETHWFSTDICDNWRDSNLRRHKYLQKFFNVNRDEFERIKANSINGLDFFDKFMSFCAKRAGKKRWVEKTPDNIMNISLIRNQWPSAKFIHVVRDLRDVYASWKLNKKDNLKLFIEKVHHICNSLGDMLGQKTNLYLEVNYHTLVFNPTQAMTTVLKHIDEPWVYGIDRNDNGSREFEKVKQITGKESSTLLSLKKPIFTNSVGQWKKVLTIKEVVIIERELKEYLNVLSKCRRH